MDKLVKIPVYCKNKIGKSNFILEDNDDNRYYIKYHGIENVKFYKQ
jgi:hypothetical protein